MTLGATGHWLFEFLHNDLQAQIGFKEMFCGEMIGHGTSRRVYTLAQQPDRVLKIEYEGKGFFHNVEEWRLWNEVSERPELSKWLAPCYSISANGMFLIQARTQPLERLPDKVPAWLGDFKRANWGLYEDRPVCHDYANHRVWNRGLKLHKMIPTDKEIEERANSWSRQERQRVMENDR